MMMAYRYHSVSDLIIINCKVKILKFLKNLIYASFYSYMALVITITEAFASWKECKNLRTNRYFPPNPCQVGFFVKITRNINDMDVSKLVCLSYWEVLSCRERFCIYFFLLQDLWWVLFTGGSEFPLLTWASEGLYSVHMNIPLFSCVR